MSMSFQVPIPEQAVKSWHVYIVECAGGSLYTGISTDVDTRVSLHNQGKGAKYTRSRAPVKLVYMESAETKGEALRREIEIKRLSAKEKRKLFGAKQLHKSASV